MNTNAAACHDSIVLRAKRHLIGALQYFSTTLQFQSCALKFLDDISHLCKVVRSKPQILKLKMEHLDNFYEQELNSMKVLCFRRIKQKKFKRLALRLSSIPPTHKQALITQYFLMCKNIFLIRQQLA